ncbi:16422_t:CDS:2 [Dentiscutata heterogama]|uniref:16422_t:CDS:1 n=1 Tax=Dentiscutata heterogama TaxID=1316150 RepID=A0ACA9KAS3_9GLOM|nr:16422_t:CDS:2 [Dentiscutata heterogama]
MEISLFPNSRPTKLPDDVKRIKVNIISDEKTSSYIMDDLDKDKTLGEIRKILSSTEDVLMGWQNAVFRNKLKRKIPLSQEDKYKLEDILVSEEDNYTLTIELNQLPSFPNIKRKHNIEIGYKKHNNGSLIEANRYAFFIKNSHLMSITLNSNFQSICKKTSKNFDELWIKSFEEGYDFLDDENEELALNECTIKYCEKGSIILSRKDLEATREYIKVIEDALDDNLTDIQKVEALVKAGEIYGFFWLQEIKLGGKFMQVVNENGETRNKTVGGDHAKHQSTSDWLKSLESYNEWEIIGYGLKLSLYSLLPEDLQLKIKHLNGIKVLYSNVYNVRMIRGYNLSLPVVEPIPVPPHISTLGDCKIFATIFNREDRKPYKNVFSIRIDYLNEETPFFVIHRIGKIPHNLPQIDLLIPWMIVGYENNLPLKPFLDKSLISYLITKNPIEKADDTTIVLERSIPHNHCWITTITLNCRKNDQYQFARSRALINCHLQSNDRMVINLCYNVHNNENNDDNPLKFGINCTMFSETDTGGLIPVIVEGPTKQPWRNRRNRRFLVNDRSLFTGKWIVANNNFRLPEEDNLVFSSLLSPDDPGQGCNNLFLNVNPKYPIIKSLNNINSNPNCLISFIILREPM